MVIGLQSTLPTRYNRGGNWGTYWPNDIDPCVFFDEDGQMWMSYGSWSGGIFMLKLYKEKGLRDYTVTYPESIEPGTYMVQVNGISGSPDEPTKISFVKTDQLPQDGWYSVQGIKLQKAPTQSGVYIYNGKKQVIK